MTIGDRIKLIREGKGIGQTELARATNISKQNIHKYENNIITNIPSNKIEAIANYLCVSPAVLMGWEDIDIVKEPAEKNPLLAELSSICDHLTDEDIAHLIALAKSFAQKK